MVARKFIVHHADSSFDVDYDTDNGLEVFKFQLFSLTSVPPHDQKILCSDDNKVVLDDSDLISISDKLRLISIDEQQVNDGAEACAGSSKVNEDFVKSDEELARMLQAEEEALLLQEYVAGKDKGQMQQKIRPYIDQVSMYEDLSYQEAARKTVPAVELEEKALVALAKKGDFAPTKVERDHAFLLELLFWFKQSFSWVNAPPCGGCGSQTTSQGMGAPLPEESHWGGSRVEIYRCRFCSRMARFPRYTNPMKLLETRKGRCGEWANCFTLYCRAFGYESRLILDLTDHVWTECFSNHLGRWMHLDPCEGIYDNPLLYEKGWKKNLNYVIAIAKDGVYDVTKRYTRKWHEVLARRNITTEPVLSSILVNLTNQCRRNFNPEFISVLEERDRNEVVTLERALHLKDDAVVSLPGRLSGDKKWRISRSEYGSGESNSLSSSSCPVRLCVDEHVTKIYDALGVVVSLFVDSSLPVSGIIDVLKTFRKSLMDLKKSPFRTRRTIIRSSDSPQPSLHQLLPAFDELLRALHLKYECDTRGEMVVYLGGDPVKTSLALPVAFDVMDDMIKSLGGCDNISKDSLCLPLLKLNRIHSGSVLASGEELPFGIATCAFDGTRLSKWEEPNGAKGCWIAYKLKDEKTCKLLAYELMSANDAPERDPMDWILEGSSDWGSSWYVLDKQTLQKFENRFERKLYKIESSTESNAFRFSFLAVRDVQSTSRLQISSIDLYSRKL